MTRKPRMASEDDQTRRFAAQPCLVPTPAAELLMALAHLRWAMRNFTDPRMPEVMAAIEAIEASIRAANP